MSTTSYLALRNAFPDIIRLNAWQPVIAGAQNYTYTTPPTAGIEVAHGRGLYSADGSGVCTDLPHTPYTIDLFIDRAHPWVYGVGNFKAGAPSTYCPP